MDNDLSAYSGKERPRFQAMLADIDAGLLDAVVVYHQDRLTRRPAELETFIDVCQRAGVKQFATVTGLTDLGPGDGITFARILSAFAAAESDAKSRRIKRKNDERAERGLPHISGQRPFGYELDRMTVRESEAVHVRDAATAFLAGESLNSITGRWSEQGVRTATGTNEWRTPTLRNLLMSPRIAGLREHRGEVVGPAAWPAIITEEQHHRITTKLTDPSRRTMRSPRRYVLSGLVFCRLCETKMVSSPDAGRRRYGCRSGNDFGGCGKVYVSGDALDRFISDVVLLRLDTPEMADVLAGRTAADPVREALVRNIDADAEQLTELATAYAEKVITMSEWVDARKIVQARHAARTRELNRLNRDDTLSGLVGQGGILRQQWDSLNLTRQAAIIRAVVDEITVSPASRPSNRMDPSRIGVSWRS